MKTEESEDLNWLVDLQHPEQNSSFPHLYNRDNTAYPTITVDTK